MSHHNLTCRQDGARFCAPGSRKLVVTAADNKIHHLDLPGIPGQRKTYTNFLVGFYVPL